MQYCRSLYLLHCLEPQNLPLLIGVAVASAVLAVVIVVVLLITLVVTCCCCAARNSNNKESKQYYADKCCIMFSYSTAMQELKNKGS